MDWAFPHRVEYEADAASVDEVVRSLLAQKKLLEEGAALFCGLVGLELTNVQVRVKEVSSGSLLEELIVTIYGKYQTEIEDNVIGGLEEMLGVDVPEEWETIVTLAALAVTYFVARFAYDAIRGKKQDRPVSTHIEGDYNIVINNIASKMNVESDRVRGALEGSLTPAKKRSLIRTVTDFFGPARRNRGTKITVDGHGDITPETIGEYPNDADLAEIDASRNLDLPNTRLEIRAMDKDRSKQGWAARIVGDDRFKSRLPMDLYPIVDGEELAKLDEVTADVILEGEERSDGSFKAKKIHLLDYQKDADDNPEASPEEGRD